MERILRLSAVNGEDGQGVKSRVGYGPWVSALELWVMGRGRHCRGGKKDVAVEDVAPDGPAEGNEDEEHEEDAEPAEVAGGGGMGAGAVDVFGKLGELGGGVGWMGGVGGRRRLFGVEAVDPGGGIEAEDAEVVAEDAMAEDAGGELADVPGF